MGWDLKNGQNGTDGMDGVGRQEQVEWDGSDGWAKNYKMYRFKSGALPFQYEVSLEITDPIIYRK